MTDFTTVRIPATRTGSGIRRVVLPSQTVRVGGPRNADPGLLGVRRLETPLARTRRHVTKGFYSEWPESEVGQSVVDVKSIGFDSNDTAILTVVEVGIGAISVLSLPGPNSIGQILIHIVTGGIPGSPIDIDTSYGAGAPYPKIMKDGSEYTLFTFNQIGEAVSLMSGYYLNKTSYRWFEIDQTSGVTWTT